MGRDPHTMTRHSRVVRSTHSREGGNPRLSSPLRIKSWMLYCASMTVWDELIVNLKVCRSFIEIFG
jgi:hypothetical protein